MRRFSRKSAVFAVGIGIAVALCCKTPEQTYPTQFVPRSLPMFATPRSTLDAITSSRDFPFPAGYRWIYEIENADDDMPQIQIVESEAASTENGEAAVRLTSPGDDFFWSNRLLVRKLGKTFDVLESGDGTRADFLGTILPEKIELGVRWSRRNASEDERTPEYDAAVIAREKVATSLGIYDAWAIQFKPTEPFDFPKELIAWFAPEIGFVRFDSWESSGSAFKQTIRLARIEKSSVPFLFTSAQPEPLSSLPGHVPLSSNAASLFVDNGDICHHRYLAYVINNTDKRLSLSGLCRSECMLSQEHYEAGAWIRSQAHSAYRDPSHSLPDSLPAHSFCRAYLWSPTTGKPAKIRYRCLDFPLVSNEVDGIVNEAHLLLAQHDLISVNPEGSWLVRKINSILLDAGLDRWTLAPSTTPLSGAGLSLPKGRENSILLACLKCGDLDPFLDDLIFELRERMPDAFQENISRELNSGDRVRRAQVLRHKRLWDDLPNIRFPDPTKSLGSNLDSRTIGTLHVIKEMANAADVLQRVESDENRSFDIRTYARLLRCSLHDRRDILLGSSAHWVDYPALFLTILNDGSNTIEFSYARPHEIVELFVITWPKSLLDDDGPNMLPPKPGVRWFAPANPGDKIRSVVLKPKQAHFMFVNLADYFELDNLRFEVTPALKLPGVHNVPQVSEKHEFDATYRFLLQHMPPKELLEQARAGKR